MAIKLDLQSNKLDFDFAGLVITADVSDKNIKDMLALKESDIQNRAEEEAQKLKGLSDDDITPDEFDRLIELSLDLYDEIYKGVFGEGSVHAVYEHIGSIQNTVNGFEQALDHITKEFEERNKKQNEQRKSKVESYKQRKSK